MSKCIKCHHPVASGGDRHAKGKCPVAPKGNNKKNKRSTSDVVSTRGVAVAGTGKIAASGDKSARKSGGVPLL